MSTGAAEASEDEGVALESDDDFELAQPSSRNNSQRVAVKCPQPQVAVKFPRPKIRLRDLPHLNIPDLGMEPQIIGTYFFLLAVLLITWYEY